MPATAPTAFQMRVTLSSVAILRTPSPRAADESAGVPSSVSSAVGSARVPSLSLRRLTRMSRSAPVASRSSTRNSASPRRPAGAPSVRASVSAICDVVADVNHFVPYSR